MLRYGLFVLFAASSLALAAMTTLNEKPAPPDPDRSREQALQLQKDGNYAEAYDLFHQLVLSEEDGKPVGEDLTHAIECLKQLGREDEIDGLIEAAVKAHDDNPYLLRAAAQGYLQVPHHGMWIGGEFIRGNRGRRGQGAYVEATEYDRDRAVQLLRQAIEHGDALADDAERAQTHIELADAIDMGRTHHQSWRLQEKTDFSELPSLEPDGNNRRGWGWQSGNAGAAVNAEGDPVLYEVPESFESADNDGQRWRWALNEAKSLDEAVGRTADFKFASFLHQQFGVRTLQGWSGWWRLAGNAETGKPDDPGPYSLKTLSDEETIAKLATGVERFDFREGFNYIAIYKSLIEGDDQTAEYALQMLIQVYEDRRQFPEAAERLRELIERFGPGPNNHRKKQLDQIVGNWIQFGTVRRHVAGEPANVNIRYRNGEQVKFTAKAVKYEQLIDDAMEYLRSKPKQLDRDLLELDRLGYRLIRQDQEKYIGEEVASWNTDLDPAEDHSDRLKVIETPLKKAGVYLLSAEMEDGNTDYILVWLTDMVISQVRTADGPLYFVADAETGAPVANASVEIFGYELTHRKDGYLYKIKEVSTRTSADGFARVEGFPGDRYFHWLAVAGTDDGRLAHLGFDMARYGSVRSESLDQTKSYIITDRPLYRPGQTVETKIWVRQVGYDLDEEAASLASEPFTVRINNPRGEKVLEKSSIADKRGGIELEYELPDEATLGRYHVQVMRPGHQPEHVQGGASFRVEEYKKPEFEVTVDAPDEPVMLGEPIKATIHAKYYFGSPVTNASVHYKVTRTATDAHWYPPAPWDWFYGSGYWWFASSYDWYPGFSRWGCFPPSPPWWPRQSNSPEIVAENEVPIGEDGTVEVTIDTAIAKEIFGDSDHQYEITAEVTDASRRTITGSGSVYAPREPFKVFAWVDHGYFQAGDTVDAHFKAQTIDQKPVAGDALITLYRVSYDKDGTPIEEQVEQWKTETGDDGKATQRFEADESGQYRIACVVTDKEGHVIEGGYLLTVMPKESEQTDPTDYRYNDLELIADKREYRPGDTARLLVATARPQSTVLIFIRPENGIYPEPRVLKLDGKAEVVEIEINKSDMPNIFVEAVTISDGEVHNVVRELHVPPEKRIVNVEVQPSQAEYKPGEEAAVEVKLTDLEGEPVTGEVVLTMYDRGLEYISGGPNVSDIREFFWKWQRNHHPQIRHNLDFQFHHVTKPGETAMGDVGAFGHLLPIEDLELAEESKELPPYAARGNQQWYFADGMEGTMMRGMGLGGGMGGFGGAMPAGAPAPAEKSLSEFSSASDAALVAQSSLGEDAAGNAAPLVEATIRSDFADSAVWEPGKVADENGLVTLNFKMPENLTDWKIRTWALGTGTRVGEAESSVVTRKNLLVRMQAPRFFTETDEVILSANVHNYLKSEKQAQVTLKLDGDSLEFLDDATHTVTVPADGEVRVDWRVKAVKPGEASVTMEALTDEESDAMQKTFPVQVHGMLRTESYTGTVRPDETEETVEFEIPEKRREGDSRIEVRFSPSLAAAMVDALPYLAQYPYGCTEQTLNRFLPTVITQGILKDMELDLEEIRKKQTNLNAQELGDPEDRRKRRWSRLYNDDANPVWDEVEVQKMAAVGVNRLIVTQSQDGGWGWFPGSGDSSAHMTALVIHGLKIAKENGLAVPDGVMQRGVEWLKRHQQEELAKLKNGEREEEDEDRPSKEHADNLDAFVFCVLVENGVHNSEMEDHLYKDRLELSPYAMAMLGLALEQTGAQDRLDMIVRNLTQFLVVDDENQTAYLRLPNEGWWWFWYGSEIEANAYYLKLLCRTDPESDVAPKLVKYLLNNRRNATYWNSTRDTAIVIEAMAEYLKVSGELKADLTVEVLYDGEVRHEVSINQKNLFSIDNTVTIEGGKISSGAHSITLRKRGEGPLYWNAYVTVFTQQDFIPAAGLEVKMHRKIYKLTREEDATASFRGSRGQAVSGAIEAYDRTELENGATLESGDLVEVELIVESKNDYEYLAFEDMKAAGFEPVEIRSGYSDNGLGTYMELRDERVAFFVERLTRGRHSIRYRLRAEIPGSFSALPAKGFAMYTPELRANSDEIKLEIRDSEPTQDSSGQNQE